MVSVNSQEPQLQRKSVILFVRQRCSGELATKGEHNQDFFFFFSLETPYSMITILAGKLFVNDAHYEGCVSLLQYR